MPAAAAPLASVEVLPASVVRGTRIILSDIARITSTHGALAERLRMLDVGPRPDGNWVRTVDSADVRRIVDVLAADGATVVVTGAPRCQAKSEHLTLRGGEVVAAAETALRARLREEGEAEAEVEATSPPIDRHVAPGRSGVELRPVVVDARMGRAGAVVDVVVRVDGEVAQTVPISFRIRRFREAITARLPLRAGEPFARDNVELRRVDVTSLPFTPVTDESLLAGKVAARAIRAGQPITVQDFRDAPVVRRGETVTIRARAGRVEITTRGVAQSDGARDALIPVLNVASQKVVFARVERTGFVDVPEAGR
jgi:flagella basal body P-ring formation protein FlgA